MTVKISTNSLAKMIIRYLGGEPRKTFSYDSIYREMGHRRGVTKDQVSLAITALEASEYTEEFRGAGCGGLDLGQRLTVKKGRPIARQMRGER